MNELRALDLAAGDPATWQVSEDAFDPDAQLHSETVFTIGNGQLCVRGSFEEGYPGDHPAAFMHRVWDDMPVSVTELANLPRWWGVDLWFDGERFRLDAGRLLGLHAAPRPAHRRPQQDRALGGALRRRRRAGLRAVRRLLLPASGGRPRQRHQRPSRPGADASGPRRPRREHRTAALATGRPGRGRRCGLAAHPHQDDPHRPGQRLHGDAGRRRGGRGGRRHGRRPDRGARLRAAPRPDGTAHQARGDRLRRRRSRPGRRGVPPRAGSGGSRLGRPAGSQRHRLGRRPGTAATS